MMYKLSQEVTVSHYVVGLMLAIFLIPSISFAAPNKIYGSSSNDTLDGTGGTDFIFGMDGHDVITGGGKWDRLIGGRHNDTLRGENGKDQLYGGHGHDRLYGGKGKDKLYGGIGNDKLYGGALVDWLDGGKGDDSLKGGGGDDLFFFARDDGTDTIFGFKEGDKLVFRLDGSGTRISVGQSPFGALVLYGNTQITIRDVSYYSFLSMPDWLYWESGGDIRSNNDL